MKGNKRNTIRLTESQFNRLISESVKRALNEISMKTADAAYKKAGKIVDSMCDDILDKGEMCYYKRADGTTDKDKLKSDKDKLGRKLRQQKVFKKYMGESRFNRIVSESVKKVLKETGNPGTLIHGTHRREDLIPAFMSEIFRNDPQKAREIWKSSPNLLQALCDRQAGVDTNWWDSEEAMYICDELQDALQKYAPEGHYFGTNMGDGSDFGYWNDEN